MAFPFPFLVEGSPVGVVGCWYRLVGTKVGAADGFDDGHGVGIGVGIGVGRLVGNAVESGDGRHVVGSAHGTDDERGVSKADGITEGRDDVSVVVTKVGAVYGLIDGI